MKTFKQFRILLEGGKDFYIKGWIHPKKKIIIMHYSGRLPYHIGMVMKNLKKFDLTPKKIMEIKSIKDESELKMLMGDLEHGVQAVDRDIENYLKEKGWCRFYMDRYAFAFASYRMQDVRNAVSYFYDENPVITSELGGTIYSEITSERFDSVKDAIYFAKTGKKAKRSEIGSTMSQFR